MLFYGITISYYFILSHNICTTTLTGVSFQSVQSNSTFDGCDKLKQNWAQEARQFSAKCNKLPKRHPNWLFLFHLDTNCCKLLVPRVQQQQQQWRGVLHHFLPNCVLPPAPSSRDVCRTQLLVSEPGATIILETERSSEPGDCCL